ncbi:MAG: hypothetical protein KKG01_06560 [Candidatus Omnitrophica bacterium]|nr:hypothetical protein [Candidatus Omnitrophota bacterium]
MDKLLCSLPKIPQERFNHFIRGYFDGDGCVSYGFYRRRGRNKKTFTISTYFISSSKEFLDNISKKLNAYIDVGLGCISKHTGNHKLSHSKNGAIKLTPFGRTFFRIIY